MAKEKEEKATVVENLDSHLTSAGQKLAENKKIIFWCVGIVAVVAAFVLSYLFLYKNPKLNNAWEAYNQVLMMQNKGEMPDSAAAIEYQKVSVNFSGTPAGNVAALASAEYFYKEKKYDDAIKLLEKFDLSQPLLQSQAKALLGDCYVNKQEYDKAISAFDQAIKIADKNPELVPLYLLKKANIYNFQKQYDKSLACYEEIKADYPDYLSNIDFYVEREKAWSEKE